MKRLITMLLAATVAATAALCEAAEVQKRRRPRGRPSGGLVTKEYRGRKILVAAKPAAAPAGAVEEALETMRRASRLPIFAAGEADGGRRPCKTLPNQTADVETQREGRHLAHTEGTETQRGGKSGRVSDMKTMGWNEAVATAKRLVRAGAAAAVVVADGGCPAAVVAAPEEGWAVVDARALAADARERVPPAGAVAASAAAGEARMRGRMEKELWRGVAFALGVGSARSCVTGTARTPAGLDLLPPTPAPDTLNRMMDAAAARGAGLLSFASYRTACEEGWAAAPTNDVQKAIWDEVHALPTEPIRILPETQKVRE